MSEQTQDAARKEIKRFFQQLNILFTAVLTAFFLFTITAYVVVYYQKPLDPSYSTFLSFGAPISGMALILMGNRLALARFKSGMDAEKLYQKMDSYRSGAILRMILVDGAGFVQLIAYIFTGMTMFLVLAMAVFLMFWLYKPGSAGFMREMNLNETEKRVVRDLING